MAATTASLLSSPVGEAFNSRRGSADLFSTQPSLPRSQWPACSIGGGRNAHSPPRWATSSPPPPTHSHQSSFPTHSPRTGAPTVFPTASSSQHLIVASTSSSSSSASNGSGSFRRLTQTRRSPQKVFEDDDDEEEEEAAAVPCEDDEGDWVEEEEDGGVGEEPEHGSEHGESAYSLGSQEHTVGDDAFALSSQASQRSALPSSSQWQQQQQQGRSRQVSHAGSTTGGMLAAAPSVDFDLDLSFGSSMSISTSYDRDAAHWMRATTLFGGNANASGADASLSQPHQLPSASTSHRTGLHGSMLPNPGSTLFFSASQPVATAPSGTGQFASFSGASSSMLAAAATAELPFSQVLAPSTSSSSSLLSPSASTGSFTGRHFAGGGMSAGLSFTEMSKSLGKAAAAQEGRLGHALGADFPARLEELREGQQELELEHDESGSRTLNDHYDESGTTTAVSTLKGHRASPGLLAKLQSPEPMDISSPEKLERPQRRISPGGSRAASRDRSPLKTSGLLSSSPGRALAESSSAEGFSLRPALSQQQPSGAQSSRVFRRGMSEAQVRPISSNKASLPPQSARSSSDDAMLISSAKSEMRRSVAVPASLGQLFGTELNMQRSPKKHDIGELAPSPTLRAKDPTIVSKHSSLPVARRGAGGGIFAPSVTAAAGKHPRHLSSGTPGSPLSPDQAPPSKRRPASTSNAAATFGNGRLQFGAATASSIKRPPLKAVASEIALIPR